MAGAEVDGLKVWAAGGTLRLRLCGGVWYNEIMITATKVRRVICGFLVAVLAAVYTGPTVLAAGKPNVSEEYLKQADQDGSVFYNGLANACSTSGGGGSLVGTGNIEKVISYYSGNNQYGISMSDYAIAGILANFEHESAFSPFRNQNQYASTSGNMSSGNGYGIAQFTPRSTIIGLLSSDSRTASYYSQYYSAEYGGNVFQDGKPGVPMGVPDEVNDAWLEVELDYITGGELTSTRVGTYRESGGSMGLGYIDSSMNILEAMNAAQSAADAARIWIWIYERAGDKPGGAAARGQSAEDTYLQMVQNFSRSGGGGASSGGNASGIGMQANGANVTIVGDSITYRTLQANDFSTALSAADIYSEVGKHMFMTSGSNTSGSSIIDGLISDGKLRDIVVIALGTNDRDSLTQEGLQGIVDKINADGAHQIVFVNNYGRSGTVYDYSSNNAAMAAVAAANPNVAVADWAAIVAANEAEILDDDYHPTIGKGTEAFAKVIADTLSGGGLGSGMYVNTDNCTNDTGSSLGGVTFAEIGGYRYAFPILDATKENYLRNTAELKSAYSEFGNVSVLSAPTNWYHHHGSQQVNEPPSADMGIAVRLTNMAERDAQYYINNYGSSGASGSARDYPYYASSGAKVVATIGGTLHWYNESRNGASYCSDLKIAGDDGHNWYYIHILRDDNLYSRADRRVEAGEVISEIGTPECADTTQSHLHFMIDGSSYSTDIADYLNPLFEALPADAAELEARAAAASSAGGTGPIGDLASSSADVQCAAGTEDRGVYSNAHIGGQRVEIRKCAVTNIRQGNDYAIVNSRVSAAFYGLAKRYQEQTGQTLSASSSFRSYEDQEYFYMCYTTKSCNGGNLAAQPGTSNHEGGLAVDFDVGGSWNSSVSQFFYANLDAFGLKRTVSSEPWHVSPGG